MLLSSIEFRPYQRRFIDDTMVAFGEYRKVLSVAPTGSGKSVMLAGVGHRFSGRKLIIAHREELVIQNADKYKRVNPCARIGVEMGSYWSDKQADIVSGSIQSLINRDCGEFELIIVDEAHHVLSKSYQDFLGRYPLAKVLGVTATPHRGDRRNLGRYFETLGCEINIRELIKDGWLSKILCHQIPLEIDISKAWCKSGGDFDDQDLSDILMPYIGSIADHMKSLKGRRILMFLPLIKTSEKMAEAMAYVGFRSAHVDGYCKDRAEKLARFANGDIEVLCNSMLVTEGVDIPAIDCVVVLRPTRSQPLYCQMVGRGTRTHPGKDHLMLVDFLWLSEKHSLVRPAHLLAGDEKSASEIEKKISEGTSDIAEAMSQVEEEREQALAVELASQRKKKAKLVDPLDMAFLIHHAAKLNDYEPVFKWENLPATEKQLKLIEGFGLDSTRVRTRGFASQVIDMAISRRKLATPRQMAYLHKFGVDAAEMSVKEASQIIGGGRDAIFAHKNRKQVAPSPTE